MLSGRGLNPGPPARQTGAYPLNWANRAAVSICKTATPLSSALTSFVVYECGRLQKRLTFLHPSQLGRVGTASLGGDNNQHSQSVSGKLRELNWRTAWRPYCIGSPGTNNLVSVNPGDNLRSPTHRSGPVHDHSFILIKISTSTTSHRLSCYPRTIVQWNSLPSDVFTLTADPAQFRNNVLEIKSPAN